MFETTCLIIETLRLLMNIRADLDDWWETNAHRTVSLPFSLNGWHLLPASGTKPPGELQIPPPPDPEPAGQAVLHARLQVGLIGRAGPRCPAPSPPWPGAGHRAHHEERTRGVRQRRQQPQQPRYSAHHDQPRQRGELEEETQSRVAEE